MTTDTTARFASACAAWLAAMLAGPACAATEMEQHVTLAESTFATFMRDPNMTWMQRHLDVAKGVLIVPKVVRAGFIFGGSGGRGVLVVRDASGKWLGPAFYTLGTASVGFQVGVDVSQVVILAMTDRAINSLLSSSFRAGADASIAAGPVGQGTSSSVQEDFVAFSRAKGLYGGLNLNGSVISANDEWNQGYYKQPVTPVDILVRGDEKPNPQAAKLIQAVAAASAAASKK